MEREFEEWKVRHERRYPLAPTVSFTRVVRLPPLRVTTATPLWLPSHLTRSAKRSDWSAIGPSARRMKKNGLSAWGVCTCVQSTGVRTTHISRSRQHGAREASWNERGRPRDVLPPPPQGMRVDNEPGSRYLYMPPPPRRTHGWCSTPSLHPLMPQWGVPSSSQTTPSRASTSSCRSTSIAAHSSWTRSPSVRACVRAWRREKCLCTTHRMIGFENGIV